MFVSACVSVHLLSGALQSFPLLVLLPWRATLRPRFREPPPRPHPCTSGRWTDARVIIFLGVAVYITQRILLKIRPPSVLNSGLISSRPSCWYAWIPVNGHSGCYRQPGPSHLRAAYWDPAVELRRTQCLWGLGNTRTAALCVFYTAEKSLQKVARTHELQGHHVLFSRQAHVNNIMQLKCGKLTN